MHPETPAFLVHAFAPEGQLRASINLGNAVLAGKDAAGNPSGVSVDLARELARRLGVGLALVAFDAANKSVEAVKTEATDIGFFAIDPLRSDGIHFTPPYVDIQGSYLVPEGSAIRSNADVDRAGVRVAVGNASAYDLFLTRNLKHATIVRAPSPAAVMPTFLEQKLEVAAGIRQQIEADAAQHPGLRVLDGQFMQIHQAMVLPISRGEQARDYLVAFIEDVKASGFVAEALKRHGITGASVSPAGFPAP